MEKKKNVSQQKETLHPRNRHRSRYDFAALTAKCPALAPFVKPNAWGDISVDFADPAAVKMLNRALLMLDYGIEHWDIPADYLCPPIPGRADYVHYLADVLAETNSGVIPRGKHIAILDVGVGANCIYPIIGQHEYGWRFTGSETDKVALNSAKMIVEMNPTLRNSVRLRLQKQNDAIFDNIIGIAERYDATLCNPPFHASPEEAIASTRLKLQKLGKGGDDAKIPRRNFGGKSQELYCEGGELAFVGKMIEQSVAKANNCLWFTSLISKSAILPPLYKALEVADAYDVRTIDMSQGQKSSRLIAWTFQDAAKQAHWAKEHWQTQTES
jgi:23S rRNA (adenine1618-N6)-methyltransferase